MHAHFTKSPNGDGVMQWRCNCISEGRIPHTRGFIAGRYKSILCNIKRKPRTGAFCKPPAYYM